MTFQIPPGSVPDLITNIRVDWLERWGRPAARRFQAKIILHEDCWLWIGPVWEQYNNLPLFWLEGWQRSARRVAWEMRHGLLSTHEMIHSTCGHPLCVNPPHTRTISFEQLTPQAILTLAQISEIRTLVAQHLSPVDIAPRFGVAVDVIQQVVLDTTSNNRASSSTQQVEPQPHPISGLSEWERQMLAHWLKQRGEPLNARERLVLTCRFGLDGQAPQILDALMAPLGVTTRERVRQIEGRALLKLKLPTQRQALRAKLDQLAQWGE